MGPRPSVLKGIAPLRVTSTLPQKYAANDGSLKPSKYFGTTHNIVESLQNIKTPLSLKKNEVLTESFKLST